MLPLVALVGRPNVGKSTIFNALTRTRDALVHDQPGVTRDRNYGVCRLDEDNHFLVVDTGGIAGEDEGLAGATTRQARAAAAEADLILFVVDAREGTSALDDEILAWLRKLSRPTLLLINKIDGTDEDSVRSEFARYGFGEMLTVSAAHRQGLDDLLDEVIQRLPEEGSGEELDNDPNRIRIAFVGRPNVGKSTLVNRILGEERMIASDVPGTTRDSIAVDLERDGREYRLIDTAGLRRRSRVDEVVEKFSVVKTMQSIEQCQVAVLMLDATEGVTDQDATVLGAVLDAGRALVIAINKWDGLTEYQREQAETMLSLKLGFVPWAESVRISAKHGSGLRELFRASEMVFGIWRDDTSPAGYRYSVMRGAPKAAFERYLAEGGPFIFCAVFREGSMEAEFMKEIYEIEQRNLNDKTMQDFCSAMWLNMAPANWSTTMGRIRDLLR